MTVFDQFDVKFNTEAPKCLLKTCFAHIMCELIDAIHEMEDVETHDKNFMDERNLLIDEIKEYHEVLKPLCSAGVVAVKKRIEKCICDANHLLVPLGWCVDCEHPKDSCNCNSVPHWCEYACGNLVSKDNPCDCCGWEDESSKRFPMVGMRTCRILWLVTLSFW